MAKLVDEVASLSTNYYGEDESLVEASCSETESVKSLIHSCLPRVTITSVKKVRNNFLAGMYLLKKEEYESRNTPIEERRMLHATAEHNALPIIKDNFNWRLVHRCKFGLGVSFSPDADYANCHCNRNNGTKRAFIISKVLLGHSCCGSQNLRIPTGICDTSRDSRGKVIVKYNDNEFLPEFVAYYNCPGITTSTGRAFIVTKVLLGRSSIGSEHLRVPPGTNDTTRDTKGNVVVKYNDHEFLPEFVAFYTSGDISKSKYYTKPKYRSYDFDDYADDDDDF